MFFIYISVPYMYVLLCELHFMRNKRWWWY